MKNFYTYLWLRENGTPYYVGKGTGKRAFGKGDRVTSPPKSRSRIIIQYWFSEEEAFEKECWYIRLFGRMDIGTGILRNRTNGGEGTSGSSRPSLVCWNHSRLKLSEQHKRNIGRASAAVFRTNDWRRNLSVALKNAKAWPKDKRDEFVRLYHTGLSDRNIAKTLGISRRTACRIRNSLKRTHKSEE